MAKKATKGTTRTKRSTTERKQRVVRMRPASEREPRRRKDSSAPRAPIEPIRYRITDEVTIVGVGASAGGLEAFSSMIRVLPSKPGFAVVLVQHLAPQHDSALPTLLTSYTPMPVVQVTEGMQVERD